MKTLKTEAFVFKIFVTFFEVHVRIGDEKLLMHDTYN